MTRAQQLWIGWSSAIFSIVLLVAAIKHGRIVDYFEAVSMAACAFILIWPDKAKEQSEGAR